MSQTICLLLCLYKYFHLTKIALLFRGCKLESTAPYWSLGCSVLGWGIYFQDELDMIRKISKINLSFSVCHSRLLQK